MRFAVLAFALILCSSISIGIKFAMKKAPHLTTITPQIASPGDTIYIYGNHFGSKINDSYVEIAGNRITTSHYISWTDNVITLTLPMDVRDGFLQVVTATGKSDPINFSNQNNIPRFVKNDTNSTLPQITEISKSSSIGKLITITGKNFGTLRNNSKVFFSIENEDGTKDFIPCPEREIYYDFWNNQEIRVRIPNGTTSGPVFVMTNSGASNSADILIQNMPGTKSFPEEKTYEISLKATFSSADTKNSNDITVHIPIPPETTTQRGIEIRNSSPEPLIQNYMNTIVHQTSISPRQKNAVSIDHTFLIPVYSVKTSVISERVKPYSAETKKFLADYLRENEIIPSGNELIQKLAREITTENSPYRKAQTIYNFIIRNYEITTELKTGETNIEELIASKNADGYDATILYCSLLRASGIPCIPIAGFYIDSEKTAHKHWWAEFYIEDFGWIPVDLILGSGIVYPGMEENPKSRTLYFGYIDANRIAFSRGWNRLISTNINNKKIYFPRTFALQSVWEEYTEENKAYVSSWEDITVENIY